MSLAGASGGAVIALKTALTYPDKVSGVMADSFSLEFTRKMYNTNILEERADVSEGQA
ncbi:MAG: esterase family protein [Spirochaetales bacterium]|nr:esterase family protein [Spirochaetales bacterium]MCF7939559.1 esterase family protein [Spirochaetales bacterium]